jgi:hypothetical protein
MSTGQRGFLALIVALMACVGGPTGAGNSVDEAHVCYVPIDIESYTPMTIEDIDERCFRRGVVKESHPKFKQIMALLASGKAAPFDAGDVRIKLQRKDAEMVFVDHYGVVKIGSTSHRLTKGTQVRLEALLTSVTTRVYRKA